MPANSIWRACSLRQLQEQPFNQREAEAAVGLATDNGRPDEMAIDDTIQDPAAALVPPHTTTGDSKHNVDLNDDEEYNAFFAAY